MAKNPKPMSKGERKWREENPDGAWAYDMGFIGDAPFSTGGGEIDGEAVARRAPGEMAQLDVLSAANEFRNALLEERVSERKRKFALEQRAGRAAAAAARAAAMGARPGDLPKKGGTMRAGQFGAPQLSMATGTVGIIPPPSAVMGVQSRFAKSGFNSPIALLGSKAKLGL